MAAFWPWMGVCVLAVRHTAHSLSLSLFLFTCLLFGRGRSMCLYLFTLWSCYDTTHIGVPSPVGHRQAWDLGDDSDGPAPPLKRARGAKGTLAIVQTKAACVCNACSVPCSFLYSDADRLLWHVEDSYNLSIGPCMLNTDLLVLSVH
jgi:hypothetical protein